MVLIIWKLRIWCLQDFTHDKVCSSCYWLFVHSMRICINLLQMVWLLGWKHNVGSVSTSGLLPCDVWARRREGLETVCVCPRGQISYWETFCRTELIGRGTLCRVDLTTVNRTKQKGSGSIAKLAEEKKSGVQKWTDEIKWTKVSELVMGVRTKGKMRMEESVGGRFEWDFDWEGVKRRQRSEEQWRDYRRVPEPMTTVCCPSGSHPYTFSPHIPQTACSYWPTLTQAAQTLTDSEGRRGAANLIEPKQASLDVQRAGAELKVRLQKR